MAVEASTVQVVLPAMGESVSEGTVLQWHKQEGDAVEADGSPDREQAVSAVSASAETTTRAARMAR